MSEKKRKPVRRKRRRGKPSLVYRLFSVAAICAAFVLALTVFFKAASIEVSGTDKLDVEEIVHASGISVGDNLFLINKFKAAEKIAASSPYVKSAAISRRLPGSILIEIDEYVPYAFTECDGDYWVLSSDGKILEQTSNPYAHNYLKVIGLDIESPAPGSFISIKEGSPGRAEDYTTLGTLLETYDLLGKITILDLSKSYDLCFFYDNRLEIRLGSPQNLDYKVSYLKQIMEYLDPGAVGTIMIGDDEEARFIPS